MRQSPEKRLRSMLRHSSGFWFELFSVCLCLTRVAVGDVVQEAILKEQFPAEGDSFGSSVAVSGDTLVVGAPGESGGRRGVNGDERDQSKTSSGAVFVFARQDAKWVKQAYLKASNADAKDRFGSKVAIDRDTIAVLATSECSAALGINGNQNDNSLRPRDGSINPPAVTARGAIYVFTRENGMWAQQAYIKPPDQETFLDDLSLSGDFMVTGRHVLMRRGGIWSYHSKLEAVPPEGFTGSVGSTSVICGDTIVAVGFEALASRPKTNKVTEPKYLPSRAGYVFVRNGDTWVQQARLALPGKTSLGTRICCNSSQDTIAFGLAGAHLATDLSLIKDNEWQLAKIQEPHYRGAVLVFHREGTEWKQAVTLTGELMPADSNAGAFGLSMSMDGDHLLIGDPFDNRGGGAGGDAPSTSRTNQYTGAIYLFKATDGQWTRTAFLKPHHVTNARLGSSVALLGSTLICGTPALGSEGRGIIGESSDEKEGDLHEIRSTPARPSKTVESSLLPKEKRYAGAVHILKVRESAATSQ